VRISILGKRWLLSFVSRLRDGIRGECDDPNAIRRRIRIKMGLAPKEELDTLIHELLHASDWHKDEAWVEQVATDIAEVLWKLGWRKESE
jgi:hypothetical protein